MTWPNSPQLPNPPHVDEPTVFPAAQLLTVADSLCGHLRNEPHDEACDYWRGVATGEYPHPDAYVVNLPPDAPMATDELLEALRRPLVVPAPLVDPALRGAA